MNINDALQTLSDCDVVVGINCNGNMKLIKNGVRNSHGQIRQIRNLGDGLDMLFDLFNQETGIKYFDESFHQEFEKLTLKHFKRMNFETPQIISTREGLWASTG